MFMRQMAPTSGSSVDKKPQNSSGTDKDKNKSSNVMTP